VNAVIAAPATALYQMSDHFPSNRDWPMMMMSTAMYMGFLTYR